MDPEHPLPDPNQSLLDPVPEAEADREPEAARRRRLAGGRGWAGAGG